MKAIIKKLAVGVLSTLILCCQMSFPVMADTRELHTSTVEAITCEQVEGSVVRSNLNLRKIDSDAREIRRDKEAQAASDSNARKAMFTIYVWVLDENGRSLSGGIIPGSTHYEPGFIQSGGFPTHTKPNQNGVARFSLPVAQNNSYQYFAYGDANKVYSPGQPPNLQLTGDEWMLKVKLARTGQGEPTFTLLKPGDSGYPSDPLNPDDKVSRTKTFKGLAGDGTTGLQGVTITARHPATGITKTAMTNAAGKYSIELDELRFGTIHLTAEKGGKPLLTSGGKSRYDITFYLANTEKSYDFGTPPDIKKYTITVNGGTANPKEAAQGDTVTVSAGAPPSGKQFKRWVSSDGVLFANATASTTTFEMPSKGVTITAEFEAVSSGSDIKTYHGTAETDTFTYGDTITVKVIPHAAGNLPASSMALYNNKGNQISAPVNVSGSAYTMTIDTSGKALSVGSNSITAKYTDRQNAEGIVTIRLNQKALTSAMVDSSLSSASKVYDGSNHFSDVPLTNLGGLISGDSVAAKANGVSGGTDVGRHAFTATTVSGLSGSDAGYYTIAPAIVGGTVTIEKADAPEIADLEIVKESIVTGTQSIELNQMFLPYGGAESYKSGTASGQTNIVTVESITGGRLSYTLKGGKAGDTVTIPVTAVLRNYQDTTVNVMITLTDNTIPDETPPDIPGGGSSGGGSSGGGSSGGGSSGGGSSGGGSSGGGSSSGGSSGRGPVKDTSGTRLIGNVRVPDYTIEGTWSRTAGGAWSFSDNNGGHYASTWAAVFNPYADVTIGQSAFDWFIFDADGNMRTGWYADTDGNLYYLNSNSDNTLGAMKTGWVLIEGKYYYFNELSDGTRGKLLRNTITPDGYFVDENGVWDV